MRDALIVSMLSVLPRKPLARLMGRFARLRLPGLLQRLLLRWYVSHYRVDMEEAEGEIEDYPTLAEFFVRALKPGRRPLCRDTDALVSPADALVASCGTVHGGRIPQGGPYAIDLRELLGGDHGFEGGQYAVLYLSPPDYHRVHMPRKGEVQRWHYLPGRLFPVFAACAERVEGLFARNERLVTWLETDLGQVALIMVGAFGVGRISAVYTNLLSNTGAPETDQRPSPAMALQRGDELGRFHLGSTVILLLEPGRVRWDVRAGQRVQVRARIATVQGRAEA